MQIRQILKNIKLFRSILPSVYFNFHYLPFKQAIRLPIILYKPKFISLKGKILIEGDLKFGMITMGCLRTPLYPNTGIVIENNGGTIVFKGSCCIGNSSVICIGEKGNLSIGNQFTCNASLKIVCYHKISFGERARFGWDCMIMDTDFHKLTKLNGGYTKGYGPIMIGHDNWFGSCCRILKRTHTPNYVVVQSGTTLSGKIDFPEYSIIGSSDNIEVKASGMWRNIYDDKIEY